MIGLWGAMKRICESLRGLDKKSKLKIFLKVIKNR